MKIGFKPFGIQHQLKDLTKKLVLFIFFSCGVIPYM